MNANLTFSINLPNGTKFEVYQGDLTREEVDAIVNAANSRLQHGGGVADAIVRAGGAVIQQESDAWVRLHGPVEHDQPAVTGAGKLPCRYIIHAVGPVWGEGEEERKLKQAVQASLDTAERMGLRSISFPAISTGVFGFPRKLAASVIFAAIREYFLRKNDSRIRLVRIVLYDELTLHIFLENYKHWKWGQEDNE